MKIPHQGIKKDSEAAIVIKVVLDPFSSDLCVGDYKRSSFARVTSPASFAAQSPVLFFIFDTRRVMWWMERFCQCSAQYLHFLASLSSC